MKDWTIGTRGGTAAQQMLNWDLSGADNGWKACFWC